MGRLRTTDPAMGPIDRPALALYADLKCYSSALADGSLYLGTILCAYSLFCFSQGFVTKDQSVVWYVAIMEWLYSRFGYRVSVFYLDGDGTNHSGVILRYGLMHGIDVRHTKPESPWLMRAETHQKSLDLSSTNLLVRAGLPAAYGCYAYYQATFNKNVSFTDHIANVPYTVFLSAMFGRLVKPNLKHLRLFGCFAVVLKRDTEKKSFTARAHEAVYIGFDRSPLGIHSLKGPNHMFVLLGDDNMKAFTSQHVIFLPPSQDSLLHPPDYLSVSRHLIHRDGVSKLFGREILRALLCTFLGS
jgi:hypothetical protein